MRERVTFQRPTQTRSGSGETRLAWSEIATVWASVDGVTARDIMQAQQAEVLATHKVIIRYRDDIDHTARMIYRGRTMELSSVIDRNNREYLEILAKEIQ
jgi:SPP1 family predicted phage head-tail adaptor